ncbi:UNVERIFIED_CONTAM: hypothetical protein Sradi_0697400 [Sesamum radiatum]|uniref:Reverse transcriptase domain-containing protein n=1 Tax=Sesamum radiatum TaxID=300843 RepID=A0AAW2VMA1_SESRA
MNQIRKLRDGSGKWFNDTEGLQTLIQQLFAEVYRSSSPSISDMEEGVEAVSRKVDARMNQALLQRTLKRKLPRPCFRWPLSNPPARMIASKTIANRLKPFLDEIISQNQSAFIPSSLITDNIFLAFELNHYLHTKTWGTKGHTVIKLDISKTYDKVEWGFLERMLTRLGFDFKFVRFVMSCVNIVSYSFLLNGCEFGSLTPTRGLRQGILEKYERASGQMVNLQKSTVTLSKNTPTFLREDILVILSLRKEESQDRYLGLPSKVGRSRSGIFAYLKDRFWEKVKGWNEKNLSQAGKEVLIKAVIQAILTYAMSVFRLPDSLISKIHSLASNFFWNNKEQTKIHWIAWKHLCMRKFDGGL